MTFLVQAIGCPQGTLRVYLFGDNCEYANQNIELVKSKTACLQCNSPERCKDEMTKKYDEFLECVCNPNKEKWQMCTYTACLECQGNPDDDKKTTKTTTAKITHKTTKTTTTKITLKTTKTADDEGHTTGAGCKLNVMSNIIVFLVLFQFVICNK